MKSMLAQATSHLLSSHCKRTYADFLSHLYDPTRNRNMCHKRLAPNAGSWPPASRTVSQKSNQSTRLPLHISSTSKPRFHALPHRTPCVSDIPLRHARRRIDWMAGGAPPAQSSSYRQKRNSSIIKTHGRDLLCFFQGPAQTHNTPEHRPCAISPTLHPKPFPRKPALKCNCISLVLSVVYWHSSQASMPAATGKRRNFLRSPRPGTSKITTHLHTNTQTHLLSYQGCVLSLTRPGHPHHGKTRTDNKLLAQEPIARSRQMNFPIGSSPQAASAACLAQSADVALCGDYEPRPHRHCACPSWAARP